MRYWPAMMTSLLALPGLAVLIGGLHDLSHDSRQLSEFMNQLLELAQTHSDIFDAAIQITAAILSLIGVGILIVCSKL